MKRTIFIFSFLTLVLVSCEDYLQEDPRGLISADQFFNTREEALVAVNGLYVNFYTREFDQEGILLYYNIGTDESFPARPMPGSFTYAVYNLDPSNGQVRNIWKRLYTSIKDANLVINRISQSPIDEPEKAELTGEAKFLRAFFYYTLATMWGDVPFWTHELDIDLISEIGKTPAEEIFDFLIKDLDEIEPVLSAQTFGNNGGRVTKWCAKMLKAKIHMWRGNWARAIEETKGIIDNSPHRLLDSFADVHRASNERNDEIIFATEFLRDVKGSSYTMQFRPRAVEEDKNPGWFNGVGNYTLLKSFEETFDENDIRRKYTVLREVNGEKLNFIYNLKKMRVPLPEGDPLIAEAEPRGNSGQDHIWLRLADTYLLLAEAENELNGPTHLAFTAINAIRKRTGLPDLEGLNQDELRQAIRQERSWEFVGESNGRKMDLIRWGILVETIKGLPAKEAAAIERDPAVTEAFKTKVMFELEKQAQLIGQKNTVLPIPADEIEKNPNIRQHPLWR